MTTLRLGGPAGRVETVTTADEIAEVVTDCDRRGEPLLVLGGGSNLVVADAGFAGTVVRIASRGIAADVDGCAGATLRVAAGEDWDALVAHAVHEGWAGVEALAGIPGSTGATPMQNVGAYGQEVAQTIARVRAWDRTDRRWRTFAAADCGFTYRHSRFKGVDRWIVAEVEFQLRPGELGEPVRYAELARALGVDLGGRAPLPAVREAVLDLRRAKGMVLDPADPDTWSAGSFFTNPILPVETAARLPAGAPRWPTDEGRVKTSAAWLIEQAGFPKGFRRGPVGLSTKHTLALTNRGGARTEDLLALAREVRDGVERAFGIRLVNEPVLVGVDL
ncbi:MAG: UDP-N-acetylmuramate dehydrogenase [Actinomycetota bacterium]|nr:UDP-N-acetylmuramate dehydrogenase [Actinomycetota bacterium]